MVDDAALPAGERIGGRPHRVLGDYYGAYGLTAARLARAAPDALVMHPRPDESRHRDRIGAGRRSARSAILDQVATLRAVRMAASTCYPRPPRLTSQKKAAGLASRPPVEGTERKLRPVSPGVTRAPVDRGIARTAAHEHCRHAHCCLAGLGRIGALVESPRRQRGAAGGPEIEGIVTGRSARRP